MKKLSDEELSDMEILKNVYVQKLLEDRGYKVLDDEGNIQLPKQKSNPSEEEVLLEEENKSLNRFSWGGFFLPSIYLLYVGKTGLFMVFLCINFAIIRLNKSGTFGDNGEIIRIIAVLIMGIRVGIWGKRRFREKNKRNFENFMKSHKLEDITFIDSFKEFSKSYKQTNIIFIIIGILLEIIISIYSIRLDILKEERKIQQQIRNSGIEKTLQDYDIDIETFFTEMANEMKGEDIRISEGIRFDKASYYDNTFLMTYTFMDYTSKELDIDKLKKGFYEVGLKNIKDKPDWISLFRGTNVIIIYKYNDKNGNALFELTFMPNDYE